MSEEDQISLVSLGMKKKWYHDGAFKRMNVVVYGGNRTLVHSLRRDAFWSVLGKNSE